MTNWPFDQPPNCAVFSVRQIVFEGSPILLVTHDDDDGGWQFLGLQDVVVSDAVVVALSDIVNLDPSVLDIADLHPGWRAWRETVASSWQRAPRKLTDQVKAVSRPEAKHLEWHTSGP
jgi:hypothetical protein